MACIKVASQAVACVPTLLFFPLFPYVAKVTLVVYWVAVTAFLYSAGSITPHFVGGGAAAYGNTALTISVCLSTARVTMFCIPTLPGHMKDGQKTRFAQIMAG